jgi:hypothetical protein
MLVRGDVGRLACDGCLTEFEEQSLVRNFDWRRMSSSERLAEYDRIGGGVNAEYYLSDDQTADLAEQVSRLHRSSASYTSNVAPSKAALRNLALGLDDVGALRELIDNAIDAHIRKARQPSVTVSIDLDAENGRLIVCDNAGGMTEEELARCLQLGSVGEHHDRTIGRFGVGAKEAMYHFGSEVTIVTRDRRAEMGLFVNVPASWLESQGWDVEVFEQDSIEKGSTRIEIGKLDRFQLDPHASQNLRETYGSRLKDSRLKLVLKGEEILAPARINYVYPPELYPRTYTLRIDDVAVQLSIGMLADLKAAGIYLYAQDRFFKRWEWRDDAARAIMSLKKKQSALVAHFRAEVYFSGPIERIPINSTKDDVQFNSVLSKASKAFDKVVAPYLDAIAFLSQDRRLSYVDKFTRTNPHRLAVVDEAPASLGRWYDAMPIEKKRLANLATFKELVDADLDASVSGGGEQQVIALDPASLAPLPAPASADGQFTAESSIDSKSDPPAEAALATGTELESGPAEPEDDVDASVAPEPRERLGSCDIYGMPGADAREIVEALKTRADELEVELRFRFS